MIKMKMFKKVEGKSRGIYSLRIADITVIAGIAVIAVCWLIWYMVRDMDSANRGGRVLTITVDGNLMGSYSLDEDRVIEIGDTNVCEINDGKAYMKSAGCPDQSCVHSRAIGSDGEVIVCLPNRVVLEVVDGSGASSDGVDTLAY